VPAAPDSYRLTYQQTGQGPYPHRSTTAWTFPSATPVGKQAIPLLVVDYQLPLDTLNRPTGRTGTFVVHQVTGTEQQSIRRFRAWTSTDSGTTWRRAPAHQRGDGAYRVKLPSVTPGAGVSLRVDVRDTAGNRIEQTLYDAYAR
jgi:hypothetical protein